MKAKILEIAQVKNEQEFYRKYPTEEAFMKVHGKAFKKAQLGANLPNKNYSLPGFPVVGNTSALPTFEEGVSNYMKQNSPATTYGDLWQRTSSSMGKDSNIDMNSVVQKGVPILGNVIRGFQLLKEEKKALQKATQWKGVTDVQLKASQLQPQLAERKYVRPEDQIYTGSEFFPIYGNETDVLAKHGKTIKANDGNTLPWGTIGNIGSQALTSIMGEDGGGVLGGTFGEGIGNIIAPGIGGAIGKVGGQLIGSLIDTRPERIKHYKEAINRNVGEIAMGEGMKGIFSSNSQYMKDGGYIKNGNMVLKNGNASPISNNIMQFYGPSHEKGGIDLFYGGSPVEVEGGETAVELNEGGTVGKEMVVFGNVKAPGYGKSFKNVVKDIAEKENKATRTLLSSANVLKSLDVEDSFDKLKFDSNRINVEGATQQLKKYKEETSHLAALQEAINATADEMRVNPEELASGKIKVDKNGAVIKAKDGYSFKTQWDDAKKAKVNQFYFEGTKYDTRTGSKYENSPFFDIIKKYFPQSEWDNAYRVMMAESAGKADSIRPENLNPGGGKDSGLFQINSKYHPNVYEGGDVLDPEYNIKSAASIFKKYGWKPWVAAKKPGVIISPTSHKISEIGKKDNENRDLISPMPIKPVAGKSKMDTTTLGKTQVDKDNENNNKIAWDETLIDVANQVLPYLRPSDTESLDPRQILGELSALGEKEEPVQAQLYHPQLTSPYKVSFQDQLNEITAQTRSAQRMVGGNAAAQAMIASQAYSAKNKVLADEFRTNQEMENRAYAENRNLLNQSILQNLAILDKQYERQSTAKSNTKAILRSALDSISDKYLKNQLENRTLATYENLYNYRYDPRFRAVNYNAPYSFNIEGNVQGQPEVLPGDREYWYNSNREPVDIRKKSKSGTTYSRNGAIVKAVNEM